MRFQQKSYSSGLLIEVLHQFLEDERFLQVPIKAGIPVFLFLNIHTLPDEDTARLGCFNPLNLSAKCFLKLILALFKFVE